MTDTDAVLVWPARLAWVDAETVTTLIAAHGEDRAAVVRPAYQGEAGFPVLLPVAHRDALPALAADRMPDDLFADLEAAGLPFRDRRDRRPGRRPRRVGRRAPTCRPTTARRNPPTTPEWGSAVADQADDAPVAGPARLASPAAES